jgi:hypothetical protein
MKRTLYLFIKLGARLALATMLFMTGFPYQGFHPSELALLFVIFFGEFAVLLALCTFICTCISRICILARNQYQAHQRGNQARQLLSG